jgi:glyoxylase-like metal-dependent hydrolase (beta-lactamase superfamily II)
MTIQITGTAQKQAWVDKTVPPVERVRPLVWSVPITMPDSPVRYTLCYLLLNEARECIVVDPGLESEEGWTQLLTGLATAGTSLELVTGIVATHLHPDHLGMVARLADVTGAWIGMHRNEDDALDQRQDRHAPIETDRAWLVQCGVPADTVDSLVVPPETIEFLTQLARPTLFLEHDDFLPFAGRKVRILATPGHTEGHVCLADEDSDVILTGDHILPRISPNVGLGPTNGTRNALAEYYESLDLMLPWDAFEVCPAHEYRFLGLADRSRDLRDHHEERAREILDILSSDPALTLWEIAEQLSWSRGWASLDGMNLRSALAETAAHVEYLAVTGCLVWRSSDQLAGKPWVAHLTTDAAGQLTGEIRT